MPLIPADDSAIKRCWRACGGHAPSDAPIASADEGRELVTFKEYAPKAWGWLREHVFKAAADEYIASMGPEGAEGTTPQLLRALAKFSEAKGGGFFFFSPDMKYMLMHIPSYLP